MCLLPDPTTIHPLALDAFLHWMRGGFTEYADPDKTFLHFATIVQSANFGWVECVIRLSN